MKTDDPSHSVTSHQTTTPIDPKTVSTGVFLTPANRSARPGVGQTLEAACAVIGGLLLVVVIAYMFAAIGLNLAGELPPGVEMWRSDLGMF